MTAGAWPDGRRVLVTGATRGIGLATAQELADRGARVVVSARSRPDDLDGALTFIGSDLTTADGATSLAAATLEALGGLDVLVDNAGAQTFHPDGLSAFSDADWEADLTINLMAAVRLDRALVPALTRSGDGAIVHVSSGASRIARPQSLAYSAAKAALNVYSKGLAAELGPRGVRVNCVLPGFIQTPEGEDRLAVRARAAGADPEAFLAAAVDGIPLGRPGTVREAAQLIAYLASPAASFVSGAQVLVDGAGFPTV